MNGGLGRQRDGDVKVVLAGQLGGALGMAHGGKATAVQAGSVFTAGTGGKESQ